MLELPPATQGALRSLLDAGARYDSEYGSALSNHQPMALLALARLGASAARLEEFAARYALDKQLRPARTGAWPAGDAWQGRFGDSAAWPAYRDLFRQWAANEGALDMLRQVLPALMRGCGAAAFHGLIRTAAALQANHAGELADGLAHWAADFLPLGDLPPAAGEVVDDPAELLRKLHASPSRAGLIALRMAEAAADGAVNAMIGKLRIDEGTPERLARAAAFAYAESGNFTALHLVTGTQAMRIVARCVEEPLAAWRWFWQAYAHGVVAARLQVAANPVQVRPWDELVASAIASDDEHVIKLVDACREEQRHYAGAAAGGRHGEVWRRAAARALA
jgi:hypothetical protein